MVIERAQAPAGPTLQQEEIPVESIGGSVIVRGLLLADRLAMWADAQPRTDAAGKPLETEAEASARSTATATEQLLARAVLLADGKPLWTVEEWKAFGQLHSEDAFLLWNVAHRLSGGDQKAIEKN